MNKKLIAVPISALLILGALVACSSGEEGPEPLVPSSTQPQGVNDVPAPEEGGSETESENAPMSDDGMDSGTTDPSLGGSSESTTDPSLSNETENGGSEAETGGVGEVDTPSEETEGTDTSSSKTGS
ncbi:hypothetical protein [Ammoniphilus sp. 3BR4]|uniref:hypothetical protein n=1 Tax=Ammoniphilus sp. 3BR4 TaxID=3158265 RepID=UPI003467C3D1